MPVVVRRSHVGVLTPLYIRVNSNRIYSGARTHSHARRGNALWDALRPIRRGASPGAFHAERGTRVGNNLPSPPNPSPDAGEGSSSLSPRERARVRGCTAFLWVRYGCEAPVFCGHQRGSFKAARKTRSHNSRRSLMKQFKNWKAIVVASIVPLLIALQPAVTYACSVGTHTGC